MGAVKRLTLFLAGLLLLPLGWGLGRSLLALFPHGVIASPPWIEPSLLACCAGYGLWSLVYLCLPPSIRLYVWGHELTHAIWGLLTGARVGPIRVGRHGGSVTLSQAGLWTTLAPYFIPFYTLVVVVARLIAGLFVDMNRSAPAWMFLVGLTWGFHITYTLRSLLQRQPDIQTYGRLFSYALILILNLLILGYVIVAATAATIPVYHAEIFHQTVTAYRITARAGTHLARQGARHAGAFARRIQ